MSEKITFESEAAAKRAYRKKQRKLILPNFIVVIIAVIAIFCQLTLPMLKVEVRINKDSIAAVYSSVPSDGSEDSAELMAYLFSDVDTAATVEVNAADCISLGFAPTGQKVREYLTGAFSGFTAALDGAMKVVLPKVMAYSIATAAELQIQDIENVPVDSIASVVQLVDDGDYDGAKALFSEAARDYSQKINAQLSEEQLSVIDEAFGRVVDSGIQSDGSFSYLQAMAAVQSGDGQTADFDIVGYALGQIPDEQLAYAGTGLFIGAAALIGATSVLWAIMAVWAFFKIFLPNKRFTMWYVKLFCWLPCFVFVIAPALALAFAPAWAGGAAAVTAVPMSFGGSGVASGICLAVLWLVSVFWLHPIKKKIRKIKKFL